jgi:hypothetical protein
VGLARRSSFLFFLCAAAATCLFHKNLTSQHPRNYNNNNEKSMNSSGGACTQIITCAQPFGKTWHTSDVAVPGDARQNAFVPLLLRANTKEDALQQSVRFLLPVALPLCGIEQSKLVAQQHVCGRSESLSSRQPLSNGLAECLDHPPLFFAQSNPPKLSSTLS